MQDWGRKAPDWWQGYKPNFDPNWEANAGYAS